MSPHFRPYGQANLDLADQACSAAAAGFQIPCPETPTCVPSGTTGGGSTGCTQLSGWQRIVGWVLCGLSFLVFLPQCRSISHMGANSHRYQAHEDVEGGCGCACFPLKVLVSVYETHLSSFKSQRRCCSFMSAILRVCVSVSVCASVSVSVLMCLLMLGQQTNINRRAGELHSLSSASLLLRPGSSSSVSSRCNSIPCTTVATRSTQGG